MRTILSALLLLLAAQSAGAITIPPRFHAVGAPPTDPVIKPVFLDGASEDTYLGFAEGNSAAVSASNTGRIRYNTVTGKLESSENGGAYLPIIASVGIITGTGTNGTLTKWTGLTSQGDSLVKESGAGISISTNLVLLPTGLTGARNFTFPDLTGTVATLNTANVFTAAQKVSVAGTGWTIHRTDAGSAFVVRNTEDSANVLKIAETGAMAIGPVASEEPLILRRSGGSGLTALAIRTNADNADALRLDNGARIQFVENVFLDGSGAPNVLLTGTDVTLSLDGTPGTASFWGFSSGSTAPTSSAGFGRFIYNESVNSFQVSENNGAYDSIALLTKTQTLTNKTLSGGTISGTIAGTPTLTGTWAFTSSSPFSVTNGQIVTFATDPQTVGGPTLTIPNFAGVSDTLAFVTLAQTFANKTLTAPTINAGALSGTFSGAPTFSGATVFSNAAPISFSTTGTTTIASASTGAVTAYLFSNTGGATTVFDFQTSAGATRFKMTAAGTLTQTGAAGTDAKMEIIAASTKNSWTEYNTGGVLTQIGAAGANGQFFTSSTAGDFNVKKASGGNINLGIAANISMRILTNTDADGQYGLKFSPPVTLTAGTARYIAGFYRAANLTTEVAQITSDGSYQTTGSVRVGSLTAGPVFSASATSIAAKFRNATSTLADLNLNVLGADPGTLEDGDVWISDVGGVRKIHVRIGGATYSVTLS